MAFQRGFHLVHLAILYLDADDVVSGGVDRGVFAVIFLNVVGVQAEHLLQALLVQLFRHGDAQIFLQLHDDVLDAAARGHHHALRVLHHIAGGVSSILHRVLGVVRCVFGVLRPFFYDVSSVTLCLPDHAVLGTTGQQRHGQHGHKGQSGYLFHRFFLALPEMFTSRLGQAQYYCMFSGALLIGTLAGSKTDKIFY